MRIRPGVAELPSAGETDNFIDDEEVLAFALGALNTMYRLHCTCLVKYQESLSMCYRP